MTSGRSWVARSRPARSRLARPRGWIGSLAVLLGLALVAGACTSPKNALGTNASPCFRALVVAAQAVHRSGRFAGVRYLSARDLTVDLVHTDRSPDVPTVLVKANEAVCVVGYAGSFNTGRVSKGWSPAGSVGHFALVIVSARQNRLLATIVLPRSPLRLARVFPLTR